MTGGQAKAALLLSEPDANATFFLPDALLAGFRGAFLIDTWTCVVTLENGKVVGHELVFKD